MPTALPSRSEHCVRPSLGDGERCYRLEADRLTWRDDGDPGSIAFADVAIVRLAMLPGGAVPVATCLLEAADGTVIGIGSATFNDKGDLESRIATYGPLVRGLLARIAAANPEARFVSGHTGLDWLHHLLRGGFAILVALTLAGVLMVGPAPGLLVLVVTALGWGYASWRVGAAVRNTDFDPRNPPARLLGI